MIRTAAFIQQNVPVRPADTPIIEIVNHRAAVAFSKLPLSQTLVVEYIDAPFRKDQRLAGKRFMDQLDVVEHRLAAAPGLIPVITNAPDKPGSLGIAEDGAGALIDKIAIVVPGNDLLICQPFAP